MFTKPLIFVVTSFLVVALVYSSISTFNVYAAPPDPNYDPTGTCGASTTNPATGVNRQTCCWTERIPGKLPPNNKAIYCQTCDYFELGTDCYPKQQQLRPLSDGVSPLEEGVLEQPPTPPPSGPFAPLGDGGVLQQPSTTTPPLFGRNIPQGGGFEILQDSETPPMFGQATPEGPTLAEEGEDIQPRNATFPTPQPFPPPTPGFKAPQISIDISPDLAPEVDQDETDEGRNDNIPDTGITEQPETQQPEDSSEGAETAGPLT